MKDYLEKICEEYVQNHNFSGVCMLKRKGITVFNEAYGLSLIHISEPTRP